MHEIIQAMVARAAEEGSRTILHGLIAGQESHRKLLSGCKIKEDWVPGWVSNAEGQRLQKNIWEELWHGNKVTQILKQKREGLTGELMIIDNLERSRRYCQFRHLNIT